MRWSASPPAAACHVAGRRLSVRRSENGRQRQRARYIQAHVEPLLLALVGVRIKSAIAK